LEDIHVLTNLGVTVLESDALKTQIRCEDIWPFTQ